MPRGGSRRGAGRKTGAATTRTREIAVQATADGITPLEVMLKAMRFHAEAKKWDKAGPIAKHAAPYIHPHLSSIDMSSMNEHFVHDVADRPLTEEEWAAECGGKTEH